MRRGDVITEWTCDEHLVASCQALQRGGEITELVVTLETKAREWREIADALDAVAAEPAPPAAG
jgi:hypothetical protein